MTTTAAAASKRFVAAAWIAALFGPTIPVALYLQVAYRIAPWTRPEWLDFLAVGISVAVGALGVSWLTRAWRPSVRVLFLGAYLWLAISAAVVVSLAVACINGDCL